MNIQSGYIALSSCHSVCHTNSGAQVPKGAKHGAQRLRQAASILPHNNKANVIRNANLSKTRVLSATIDYIKQAEYE